MLRRDGEYGDEDIEVLDDLLDDEEWAESDGEEDTRDPRVEGKLHLGDTSTVDEMRQAARMNPGVIFAGPKSITHGGRQPSPPRQDLTLDRLISEAKIFEDITPSVDEARSTRGTGSHYERSRERERYLGDDLRGVDGDLWEQLSVASSVSSAPPARPASAAFREYAAYSTAYVRVIDLLDELQDLKTKIPENSLRSHELLQNVFNREEKLVKSIEIRMAEEGAHILAHMDHELEEFAFYVEQARERILSLEDRREQRQHLAAMIRLRKQRKARSDAEGSERKGRVSGISGGVPDISPDRPLPTAVSRPIDRPDSTPGKRRVADGRVIDLRGSFDVASRDVNASFARAIDALENSPRKAKDPSQHVPLSKQQHDGDGKEKEWKQEDATERDGSVKLERTASNTSFEYVDDATDELLEMSSVEDELDRLDDVDGDSGDVEESGFGSSKKSGVLSGSETFMNEELARLTCSATQSFFATFSCLKPLRSFSGRKLIVDRVVRSLFSPLMNGVRLCIFYGEDGVGRVTIARKVAHELDKLGYRQQFYVHFPTTVLDAKYGIVQRARPFSDEEQYSMAKHDFIFALEERYQETILSSNTIILIDNAESATDFLPFLPTTRGKHGVIFLATSHSRLEHLDHADDPSNLIESCFEVLVEPFQKTDAYRFVKKLLKNISPSDGVDLCELCNFNPLALNTAIGVIESHPKVGIDRILEGLRAIPVSPDESVAESIMRFAFEYLDRELQFYFSFASIFPGMIDEEDAAQILWEGSTEFERQQYLGEETEWSYHVSNRFGGLVNHMLMEFGISETSEYLLHPCARRVAMSILKSKKLFSVNDVKGSEQVNSTSSPHSASISSSSSPQSQTAVDEEEAGKKSKRGKKIVKKEKRRDSKVSGMDERRGSGTGTGKAAESSEQRQFENAFEKWRYLLERHVATRTVRLARMLQRANEASEIVSILDSFRRQRQNIQFCVVRIFEGSQSMSLEEVVSFLRCLVYLCDHDPLVEDISFVEKFLANSMTSLAKQWMDEASVVGTVVSLLTDARKMYLRTSGGESEDVATVSNHLAVLYHAQQDYVKAEEMYLEALRIRETLWGKQHEKVANILNNLAVLYKDQEKYDQAESLLERSFVIAKHRLSRQDSNAIFRNLEALRKLKKPKKKSKTCVIQ
eukprot:TRINITY_DN702_c0_g1_i5.p1 TRINITY_DN702_c0_g1~~TRINITY_DN702_c0_g1_i5.p1  ORF type:complete len:1158 (-),score=378.83 TRINITY_DN702_c0_g1_i5:130-3603(-)